MKTTYSGHRLFEQQTQMDGSVETVCNTASGVVVKAREESGILRHLDPRADIRNHSPDGFSWGYGGSGPAQLALALCCDALGEEEGSRPRTYQAFKRKFVAKWGRTWEITSSEIIDWYLDSVYSGPVNVAVGDYPPPQDASDEKGADHGNG